ncbi:MAG: nitrophenyl compound nitroreductase subunit ArsF family protein [Paludibacteraceae bacterium]|nr:nitrophenyl compound nitroreductase subunit ArsF family protein [Paludibacteraceae bacterium]
MKKLLLLLAIISSFVACGNAQKQTETAATKINDNSLDVLYFHGKQRCITCRAIETLTKEVLDADFAEVQKSGKVIFKIIDISQKENEAIADKYEVTWSSLILDKGGKVVNLTDMGFSYAKNQPDVFKSKLKEEIAKLLQ